MFKLLPAKLWLALLWLLLTAVSLAIRPLFPIDETRYVAVAWEMWCRNDFLVPHLNGETYSHKPPLLFWLMQLSWWLFGVNDWTHRFIAPLFSLATLYLSQAVARLLWPGRTQIAELTPFILLGFFSWMVYGTLTMFDIMLSFFALLGIYGLLRLARDGLTLKGWIILGIAIGGGVLTKGPVILLHLLPIALLAPWWRKIAEAEPNLVPEGDGIARENQQNPFSLTYWYGGLVFAIVIGAAIALCWAIPAGMAGGEAYQKAIFLGQTSGRVVDSFAHKLPVWWYLQLLPLLLLPWLLMKPFWLGLRKLNLTDFGIRFCLAWLVPVFVAFSLISGKRIHYLLPLMPALALLLAWAIDQANDFKGQKIYAYYTVSLIIIGLALFLLPFLNARFHWQPEIPANTYLWGFGLWISAVGIRTLPVISYQESVATICTGSIAAALTLAGVFFELKGESYDTAPPAQKIAELMGENRPIAYYGGKYHGQFHFTGRLTQPITVVHNAKELSSFVNQNPTAYLLVEYKSLANYPESILSFHYLFKSHNVGFISSKTLIANPRLLSDLKPS